LVGEGLGRLSIGLLVNCFELIVELVQIAIGLRFHFIAGDYLDDVLSIRLCWLHLWRTALLRVSKRRYCGKSGNGGNEL
jgi:hypothetical protein